MLVEFAPGPIIAVDQEGRVAPVPSWTEGAGKPLLVLSRDWSGVTAWTLPQDFAGDQVFFLLRVYDSEGRFDESSLKPLERAGRGIALAGFGRRSSANV